MPPTVLIDFTPLGTPTRRSGIGRYLLTLAHGLAELDPKTTNDLNLLALLSLNFPHKPVVTDNFRDVQSYPWPHQPTSAQRYEWAYNRRLALWTATARTKARIVHLGDPNATPLALGLTGCKRVVTCHDLIPYHFPHIYMTARDGFSTVGKLIIRRRYTSADHIIAVSDFTRRDLMNTLNIPSSKITRVYNGINTSEWSPLDPGSDSSRLENYSLSPRSYLLYVGDVDWRKNAEAMVRSLAIANQQGHDTTLVFAGHITHKRASIEQLASQHNVANKVRFLGYVRDSDVHVLYRNAIALLLLSRTEGFGYTVIEAMASGCPVISTNLGSLAELTHNAAIHVDPEEPQDTVNAIRELMSDASLRSSLIGRGLERAPQFASTHQAQATVDVFRKCLD